MGRELRRVEGLVVASRAARARRGTSSFASRALGNPARLRLSDGGPQTVASSWRRRAIVRTSQKVSFRGGASARQSD